MVWKFFKFQIGYKAAHKNDTKLRIEKDLSLKEKDEKEGKRFKSQIHLLLISRDC